MEVVDHDGERLPARQGLEDTSERPGRLVGRTRGVGSREGAGHEALDEQRVLIAVEEHGQRLAGLVEDLTERRVGDALAVRQAASDQHLSPALKQPPKLASEARLADARRPDHGDGGACPFRDHRVESSQQGARLRNAADERRIRPPRDRLGVGQDRIQPPRLDRTGRALQVMEPQRSRP